MLNTSSSLYNAAKDGWPDYDPKKADWPTFYPKEPPFPKVLTEDAVCEYLKQCRLTVKESINEVDRYQYLIDQMYRVIHLQSETIEQQGAEITTAIDNMQKLNKLVQSKRSIGDIARSVGRAAFSIFFFMRSFLLHAAELATRLICWIGKSLTELILYIHKLALNSLMYVQPIGS